MSKIKTILILAGAILAVAISKKTGLGLVIELPIMVLTLWLMIKYRRPIAAWFKSFGLPVFLTAILSYFPFMLYEENINCLPSGCKIIPDTLPFLTILVLVSLIIMKIAKAKSFKKSVIIFSIVGFIIESTYGVGAAQIWALPLPWLIFFIPWITISYTYLVVIPVTILVED